MEEAAAQERVGQLLLVVRRDDDDRPLCRADRLAGLVDVELHPIEFEQKVVRKLDIGLVDLVDEKHRPEIRREGLPQLATPDIVANVRDPRIAELAVAQARDRIVFVEALLGLGGRLDVPGRGAERRWRWAISSASTVLPVPGSPLTRSGRSRTIAALTATVRSSVATYDCVPSKRATPSSFSRLLDPMPSGHLSATGPLG